MAPPRSGAANLTSLICVPCECRFDGRSDGRFDGCSDDLSDRWLPQLPPCANPVWKLNSERGSHSERNHAVLSVTSVAVDAGNFLWRF